MAWDVLAHEKHGEVIGEVVAVVEKQVIGLVWSSAMLRY